MEQNDKEKQFTSLIEEYKRVIYKICYMYATDGDNFKDLYKDVVINLWKGFEGYEGKGKPSSWIYRVGLNTCISFYRQQQRRGEHTSLDSLYGLEAEDSETTKRLKEMYRLIAGLKKFIFLKAANLFLYYVPHLSNSSKEQVYSLPGSFISCSSAEPPEYHGSLFYDKKRTGCCKPSGKYYNPRRDSLGKFCSSQ